jgi:hypothetical protein
VKAFAAHRFGQNGELQFAAAQNAECLRPNGDVGQQLSLQAIAQIARSQIVTFFARKRGVRGESVNAIQTV